MQMLLARSGSSNNVWDTGNGNESKIGTAMTGHNPTTPETTTVVAGKACKMFSVYINMGFVKKFAAGNVYLGELTGLSGLSGAKMTFGIPSEGRLPVAVMGYYNYQPGTIDYIDNEKKTGGTDSMDLYIALATKQYSVDTTDDTTYPGGSASDLAGDENIVAYGRLSSSETNGWLSSLLYRTHLQGQQLHPFGRPVPAHHCYQQQGRGAVYRQHLQRAVSG